MARKNDPPPSPQEYDRYAGSGKRTFLPTRVDIPGPQRNGESNPFDPNRDDTILRGHPEVAGIYCGGYDNRSKELDTSPYRMDKNYISADDVRRASRRKSGY
jgi:hypothetical protein